MREYTGSDIRRLLRHVDAHLGQPTRMELVGGAALLLGHGLHGETKDIDALSRVTKALREAWARASDETGLSIPLETVGVAELPYEFEDRLIRVLPRLRHLVILVPDAHDIALSKIMRGYTKDVDAIVALNESRRLSWRKLLTRYVDELRGHAIGRKRDHDLKMVLALGQVFGEHVGAQVATQLAI